MDNRIQTNSTNTRQLSPESDSTLANSHLVRTSQLNPINNNPATSFGTRVDDSLIQPPLINERSMSHPNSSYSEFIQIIEMDQTNTTASFSLPIHNQLRESVSRIASENMTSIQNGLRDRALEFIPTRSNICQVSHFLRDLHNPNSNAAQLRYFENPANIAGPCPPRQLGPSMNCTRQEQEYLDALNYMRTQLHPFRPQLVALSQHEPDLHRVLQTIPTSSRWRRFRQRINSIFERRRDVVATAPARSPSPLEPFAHVNQNINTSFGHNFSGFTSLRKILLRHGSEASVLSRVLSQNPKLEFTVKYENEAGIDGGGLTRQAFDRAYRQLLEKENGFFKNTNQSYELNPNATFNDAQSLGVILGFISKNNFGVGYSLGDDFYQKLFSAMNFIKEVNNSDLKAVDLNDYTQHLSDQKLRETIKNLDPSTYNNPANCEYLNSMDREELNDLFKNNAQLYLNLAQAFMSVTQDSISTTQQLIEKVCGPNNLRENLINTTQFREINTSSENKDDHNNLDKMKNWFKKAFEEASEDELSHFCRNFTGASNYDAKAKPIKILINSKMSNAANNLFLSHTCFNQIEVSPHIILSMMENDQFELFKSAIFDSQIKVFNAI